MSGIAIVGMFCEDIREDAGGLHTLVNLYPDAVTLPSFPNVLGSLGFYVRTSFDSQLALEPIDIVLRMPGQDDVLLTSIDAKIIQQAKAEARREELPFATIISMALASDFPVEAPVRVRAIAIADSAEILCGTIKFEVAHGRAECA